MAEEPGILCKYYIICFYHKCIGKIKAFPRSGVILIGDFLQDDSLAFLCCNLIGSVSVQQTVHIEQGTRSHRNQQAVHIDAGLPFTSTRVNEMGDQPVNIENETAHSKF